MGLWDTVKSWGRGIKNYFSGNTYDDTVKDDTDQGTDKETLNEKIENGTINQPVSNDTSNNINLTEGLDALEEVIKSQQTPTIEQNTQNSVASDDKENDSFLGKVSNFFSGVQSDLKDFKDSTNDAINGLIDSRRSDAEYSAQEERYAIGYNPSNRNVYYLDLNEDRGFWDFDIGTYDGAKNEFERLLNEADQKYNMPGATAEDQAQAFMDFYNKARKLFRIRSEDRYTDGLFGTAYGRRDEMYTDDELNTLINNGKTNTGVYEPTPEEFQDFLSMYLRNKQTQQEIGLSYMTTDQQQEVFELSTDQSTWREKMDGIALRDVDSMFDPMMTVNSNAATQALLTYKSLVLDDVFGRVYNEEAPVYRAEKEILSRDKSTWSEGDKALLAAAERLRKMDTALAENVNEVLRQTLLYGTDKNGNIVNTPDRFENGETLNDILTRNLRELGGLERGWLAEHQSHIDIYQDVANEALYRYRQDKDGALKQSWNWLEHALEPAGSFLGEVGQATWALGMDIVGGLSMGLLYDGLTKSYMDQDATVFRLLETDDSNIGRTIKKYYLDVTEYAPEVIGNLAPDIAMYALTGPGGLTTTARHIGKVSRLYKAVKASEGASMLNKARVLTGLARGEKAAQALGMTNGAYSAIINAAKVAEGGKAMQKIKTGLELTDRLFTQLGLGQIMDAQWSAYDTEPYSESSYLMSIVGSSLFDVMPELVRLSTGLHWRDLVTGKWGDNVWSLAKYIDSSEDAANNVAKMLRKGSGEMSFEDLKSFVKSYSSIEEAAKQAYKELKPEEKAAIGKMTKDLTYAYVNQTFGANSTIGKRVRQILQNKNTNIADAIKYLGNIPGEVSVGPFVSTIQFKNGTRANVFAKSALGEYDPLLDNAVRGGFSNGVSKGFTRDELSALSKIDAYSETLKNREKLFTEIIDDKGNTTYHLTKEGLDYFGLRPESMSLESLGVTLAEAENTAEALQKIKGLKSVNLSDTTIQGLSETGAYDEITGKVRELLGC